MKNKSAIAGRKLVAIEQATAALNRFSGTFNVVTISRNKGTMAAETLSLALDRVQRRHPLLKFQIIGDEKSFYFEPGAEKIPLRLVESGDRDRWQEVVRKELNYPIEITQCLMRCVLLFDRSSENIFYVIVTVHHGISDGRSAIALHSEILTYCQSIASGEAIAVDSPLSPIPTFDALMPESMQGSRGKIDGLFFILKIKLKELLYRPKKLTPEQKVPLSNRRTGMIHRQLDERLTEQLVRHCRQYNTTVQGALCAAMLLSAAKIINGNTERKIKVFCQSYVDIRPHTTPSVNDENLGSLFSFVTSFHSIPVNPSFWEIAKEVRQQVQKEIEKGAFFKIASSFGTVMQSILDRPNQVLVTAAVTNVGRVNIPSDRGAFEIEEISFVPGVAVFCAIPAVAVATFRGKMVLNFMFSEPSISPETMEIMANDVVSHLVKACGE